MGVSVGDVLVRVLRYMEARGIYDSSTEAPQQQTIACFPDGRIAPVDHPIWQPLSIIRGPTSQESRVHVRTRESVRSRVDQDGLAIIPPGYQQDLSKKSDQAVLTV